MPRCRLLPSLGSLAFARATTWKQNRKFYATESDGLVNNISLYPLDGRRRNVHIALNFYNAVWHWMGHQLRHLKVGYRCYFNSTFHRTSAFHWSNILVFVLWFNVCSAVVPGCAIRSVCLTKLFTFNSNNVPMRRIGVLWFKECRIIVVWFTMRFRRSFNSTFHWTGRFDWSDISFCSVFVFRQWWIG